MENTKKLIWVQLRDRGSIFQDTKQKLAVTGLRCVQLKHTKKVKLGLQNHIIKEVTEKEAIAINEGLIKNVKPAPKPTSSKAAALAEDNVILGVQNAKLVLELEAALEKAQKLATQVSELTAQLEALQPDPVQVDEPKKGKK